MSPGWTLAAVLPAEPAAFAEAVHRAAAAGFTHVEVAALADRPAEHLAALSAPVAGEGTCAAWLLSPTARKFIIPGPLQSGKGAGTVHETRATSVQDRAAKALGAKDCLFGIPPTRRERIELEGRLASQPSPPLLFRSYTPGSHQVYCLRRPSTLRVAGL